MKVYNIDLYDIFLSILRWFFGLSVGSLIGLMLGIITDYYNRKAFVVSYIFDFLRAIPIIGLVPVVQMNFGINEYGKIGLIAWATTFPISIAVNTSLNIDLTNASLILKGIKPSKIEYFKYFYFPRVFGGFLKGIDIGIGIAWLSVVAAEWIGTYSTGFWSGGLGYKLDYGYTLGNWSTVHFSLLIFGILGFISSYIYRATTTFLIKKNILININF